jgi:hypothetical protein
MKVWRKKVTRKGGGEKVAEKRWREKVSEKRWQEKVSEKRCPRKGGREKVAETGEKVAREKVETPKKRCHTGRLGPRQSIY